MIKPMHNILQNAISITEKNYEFEFSICTLVTQKTEYIEMLNSFNEAGFTSDTCEFLYIDNSIENKYDAFQGLNLFLKQAKGKYIIVCHQDILINKDNRQDLKNLIVKLDGIDKNWAVCGNAGAMGPNHVVYHITYSNDETISKGNFPLRVSALDENFLLIKNEAVLSCSANLSGFHLYGTDLCLNAELNGYTSYAISFNLTHKSKGTVSPDFFKIRKELIKKYNHFFRSRWIQTNCTVFYISGSLFGRLCGNPVALFFVRMKNGLYKKWNNGK